MRREKVLGGTGLQFFLGSLAFLLQAVSYEIHDNAYHHKEASPKGKPAVGNKKKQPDKHLKNDGDRVQPHPERKGLLPFSPAQQDKAKGLPDELD